jgi:hypothetical protein
MWFPLPRNERIVNRGHRQVRICADRNNFSQNLPKMTIPMRSQEEKSALMRIYEGLPLKTQVDDITYYVQKGIVG